MIYSKPMSYTIIGGYIALSLLVSTCYAGPYIQAGQSSVNLVGSGAWYVDELPHQLETRNPAWSVGWRGPSWRLGYVDFGDIESDARAYNPDTAYVKGRHSGCPSKGCAPSNRYRGKFKTDGLIATYEPRWGIFTAGAGLAYLRYRSSVSVDMSEGPNPYTEAFQKPQSFTVQVNCVVENYHCTYEKQLTYLLTAGLEGRHWSLSAQAYPNAFGTGGIFKGITTLVVGYKF